jgi:DNA-binding MarR family transcriptional regulator
MRLDGPRASLLSVLVFAGPQTMSRLAEMERVTPAAITKLVSALERDGLAVRLRDGADRRVVRVEATPAGEQVLRAGRAARVRVIAGLLRGLSKQDLAAVDRAAELLEQRLRTHAGHATGRA